MSGQNIKKEPCKYCRAIDKQSRDNGDFPDNIPITGKGYAIEHGDIISSITQDKSEFFLMHYFTPSDCFYLKMKIHFCPQCGRRLDEK